MRESGATLDFLPPAYRALRRRWRWAMIHVAVVLLLAIGLLLGVSRVRDELSDATAQLRHLEQDLDGAKQQQHNREALQQLHDQLLRQDRLLGAAGIRIEPSRLLASLERAVPADMALTDLSLQLIDRAERNSPAPVPSLTSSTISIVRNTPASTQPSADLFDDGTDRRHELKVALRGVAPGEISIGNLLATLSKTPFFNHVTLTYAKDLDHLSSGSKQQPVREFEVTFLVDITSPGQVVSAGAESK